MWNYSPYVVSYKVVQTQLIKCSLYCQKNVVPEISFPWILIFICSCVKKSVGKVLSDFSELLQPQEDSCLAPLPMFLFIPKGREQKAYFIGIHSPRKTPRIHNNIYIFLNFLHEFLSCQSSINKQTKQNKIKITKYPLQGSSKLHRNWFIWNCKIRIQGFAKYLPIPLPAPGASSTQRFW